MSSHYKLQHSLLAMALAAAYPLHAQAAPSAGVAQFIAGDVNVRRGDGKTDPLLKGKDIESGQSIVTGANGRAQVKFSDGGVVSLQPNTDFKIANYVDENDPKQDRFLVDLLRGSMRAITGLIGKRNHDNYKVTTSTATIGIRGSGFSAGYNPDGSLSVTTELDAIEVCTAAGCVGLTAGESVMVRSNQSAPVRTNTRADVPTPDTKQDAKVAGNQVDESGTPTALTTEKSTPSRLLVGVSLTSVGLTTDGLDRRASPDGALLVETESGLPSAYISRTSGNGQGSRVGSGKILYTTGSIEGGDYAVLGTWDSSTWTATSGMNSGTRNVGTTAFAAGIPSPYSALVALSGQRATYSLLSATPVFASMGGSGTLLSSSKLDVDFTGATVDVNLNVSMPANALYNLRGGVTAYYAGQGFFVGSLAVSGTACSVPGASCDSGTVAGGFSGSNANYAGISFGAYSSASGYFGGAAAFTTSGHVQTPVNTTQTDMKTQFADGGGGFSEYSSGGNYTVNPLFNGEKLNLLVKSEYGSSSTVTMSNDNPLTGSYGFLGKVTDSDFIGWGNWISGTKSDATAGYVSCSESLNSVHYLTGRPTAVMPYSGIGTYAWVGNTNPTATKDGVTQAGVLQSASLIANFGSGQLTASVGATFGATAVNINNQSVYFGNSATFSGTDGSGTTISGMFTGAGATRAGILYSIPDSVSTIGTVAGAVVFQRSGTAIAAPTY